jgi:hypothetical protein
MTGSGQTLEKLNDKTRFCRSWRRTATSHDHLPGKKTRLLAPFDTKNDPFAKTGSGQNTGKAQKETRFLIGRGS